MNQLYVLGHVVRADFDPALRTWSAQSAARLDPVRPALAALTAAISLIGVLWRVLVTALAMRLPSIDGRRAYSGQDVVSISQLTKVFRIHAPAHSTDVIDNPAGDQFDTSDQQRDSMCSECPPATIDLHADPAVSIWVDRAGPVPT
nr:hypothetical protein [Aeromicrobium piscarium]